MQTTVSNSNPFGSLTPPGNCYSAAAQGFTCSIKPQSSASKVKVQFTIKYLASDILNSRLTLGVVYTTNGGSTYSLLGQDTLCGSVNASGPLANIYTFIFMHAANTTNTITYTLFFQLENNSPTNALGLPLDTTSANCIILEEYLGSGTANQGSPGATGPTGPTGTSVLITSTSANTGYYLPLNTSTTTRVQSLYTTSNGKLTYNPSTNILQNPNFLVSDGTESASTGGLFITTGGFASKTIYSQNNTGATNNSLSIQTSNTGNSFSSIYDTRYAGSGSGGTAITAFPSWSLTSNFFTPAGSPYSTGNFNMLGSCCNMATQLVPNGSESGVVVGFQSSIGDNSGYADMFYNSDNFATASPYILRLNSTGLLAYGVGTAGTYTFGTPNPTALTSTYFSINGSGLTTINNGVVITNTASSNTITISGNPLIINFGSRTFKNFVASVTVTTTISSTVFSNPVEGGSYMVYISTGIGITLTINTGLSGIKTTFSSAFTIPASSFAVMNIYYINSVYVLGINILT